MKSTWWHSFLLTLASCWVLPGCAFLLVDNDGTIQATRRPRRCTQQPRPNVHLKAPLCRSRPWSNTFRRARARPSHLNPLVMVQGPNEDIDGIKILNSTADTAIIDVAINRNETDTTSNLTLAQAKELRQRAQALRAEARRMEVELDEWRNKETRRKGTDGQFLMDRLFGPGGVVAATNTSFSLTDSNQTVSPAGQAVARILREERWSIDQALAVVETIYQRRLEASHQPPIVRDKTNAPTVQSRTFQIGDVRNAMTTYNRTQVALMDDCLDILLEASELLDEESSSGKKQRTGADINTRWGTSRGTSTLKARWNALRRDDEKELERRIATVVAKALPNGLEGRVIDASTLQSGDLSKTNDTAGIQSYVRQTLGMPVDPTDERSGRQLNLTVVLQKVNAVPRWIPSTLWPYMKASRAALGQDDVTNIKQKVLSGAGFYCTSTETVESAALFRGNIRLVGSALDVNQDAENVTQIVFAKMKQRMDQEKISDRVQLFFMPDPEWRPGFDEREPKPRPVVLAIPKSVEPDDRLMQQSFRKTLLKRASVILALTTSFLYSVGCFSLNPKFLDGIVNKLDASSLLSCVPIILGVFGVQAIHEIAHIIAARRRGIKIGAPLPLPSTQLGLFGCITPLYSFPTSRSALLDFALSGPMAGYLASFLLMIVGTLQTTRASEAALGTFPFLPVGVLKSSFLAGSILSFLAPKLIMLPISQPVPISPLFMIGFAGAFASALNLLPIFRLDGGRACSAAMGERFGAVASSFTLLLLLSMTLSGDSSFAFNWGVMVVLFQRRPEIPVRDSFSEVDTPRLGVWLLSLVAAVVALVPFPGGSGFP